MEIDNLVRHTAITGLFYHRNRLFVGCGQNLEIYCLLTNQQLIKKQLFDAFNVYGVYVYVDQEREFIIVHGNRFFSVYELINESSNYKVVLILDRINLYDLILEIEFRDKKINCLLSSNKLGTFDLETGRLNVVDCEEKCIVYTSKFLNDYQLDLKSNQEDANSIFVAAGTVFSKILILNYTDKKCTVIDRLTGHEGVLFALDYKKQLNLLVSASDDRQIRCWYFNLETNSFECKHVLYGHESRIWQVKLSTNCIISSGECSSLIFWSLDGKCLFKEKSKKASIWRICLNDDKVFYGCSDGSVKQRSIGHYIKSDDLVEIDIKNTKRFELFEVDDKQVRLFVSDTDGLCKLINLDEENASVVCELDFGKEYSNYNVLTLLKNDYLGILGNITGELSRFKIDDNQIKITSKTKVGDDKLFNLFTIDNELITHLPKGEIDIWNLNEGNIELSSRFNLSSAKETQINHCLRLNENLIVFGDRSGNVFVYKKTNGDEHKDKNNPINSSYKLMKLFNKVHHPNGVKHLRQHPFETKFYSTGRDGRIIEYGYSSNGTIDLLHCIKIGISEIDWICRIEFDKLTGDLAYVFGFKSTLFIVWNNLTQSIIYTIESSGGNRPLSMCFNSLSNRLNLVFVKFDKLIYASKQLDQSLLIKPKFHTATVLCSRPLFNNSNNARQTTAKSKFYFLTASEDSELLVNSFDKTNNLLVIEDQLDGHNSNIRSLAVVDDINDDHESLVVSVGGSSQMMIWKLCLDTNQKLIVKQIANYFLANIKKCLQRPWINQTDSQIRFMDVDLKRLSDNEFLITTICSDSNLRIFRLSLNANSIQLVSTCSLSKFCLLKLVNVNELNLITSTDGHLRFIELNLGELNAISLERNFPRDPLGEILNQSTSDKEAKFHNVLQSIELHQFGINTIDLLRLENDHYLILTAGEDTRLGYALIRYDDKNLEIKFTGNCLLKHYSMVSRVKFLSRRSFATASWDRKIKLWNFELDEQNRKLELNCVRTIISSIPDINELIVDDDLDTCDSCNLIVLGEGIEIYRVSKL